jgi:serine/threonine-protein kinase
MAARLTRAAPDPRALRPDTPAALAEIVLKLLARQRTDRFANADDVAKALASVHAPAREASTSIAPPAYPKAAARGDKTVAVLPLKNEGAPDYVASGLHEDLVDTLSMTRGLRVRPLTMVTAIDPRARASTHSLGETLGVQILVEGSLRAAGPDLRLTLRAIGVEDDFQIWAGRFVRPAGEVLSLADEAAHAIADALTAELDAPARGAQESAAADVYLRARDTMREGYHSKERLARAAAMFDAALALAPKDPRMLAGAATAHVNYAFYETPDQAKREIELARDLAERAIAIAPQLGEPWIALATVRRDAGELVAMVRALHTALRVAPKTAEAREMLAHILLDAGAVNEALDLARGALEINPTFMSARVDAVRAYALLGQRDEALALLELPVSTGSERVINAWARARYCMWRPDERWKKAALGYDFPQEGMMSRLITTLRKCVETGTLAEEDDTYLRAVAEGGTQRIRLFTRQQRAELLAASGASVEDVVRAVDEAMSDSAGDVAWMDLCPLFEKARGAADWARIRMRVDEGASKVRAAFFDS